MTQAAPIEFVLYGVAAALAVIFRYLLKLTDACLVVGKAISDVETGTGFQDAITPPMSTKLTIATWIAIPVILGFAAYELGWARAGIAFGLFVFVSMLVGAALIPGPESPHFVRLIYGSMIRRYADFEKEGNHVRSAAMKDLIGRIESRFVAKLVNTAPSIGADENRQATLRNIAIVAAYGTFLEQDKTPPDAIRDANVLPLTKEQILTAIVTELARVDDPKKIGAMEVGALLLANYQEGVGDAALYSLGEDVAAAKLETEEQIRALAGRIANDPNRERYEAFEQKAREERDEIVIKINIAKELGQRMSPDKKRQVFGI